MTSFAEYTRKKKKTDASESAKKNTTFREHTQDVLGIDIAPIRTTTNEAPVKTTVTTKADDKEEKWYDGWLKKSEGNAGEAVAGSSTDLFHKITKGFVGAPETIGKGLVQLAPYWQAAQKQMNGGYLTQEDFDLMEEQKKASAPMIEKDWYDQGEIAKRILSNASAGMYLNNATQGRPATLEEYKLSRQLAEDTSKYIDEDMEKHSVFDEELDAVAESGGEMLFRQIAPVNGLLLGGLSGLDSQAENALKDGATYDQATLSGLISGAGEAATELLGGGISFGSKTLDDLLLDPFLKKIGSKAARTGAKITAEVASEGLEEVISEVISNAGTSTYKKEELKELLLGDEAIEGYRNAFISGGLLGAVGSGTKATQSAVQGKDYTTGLSKNEEAVIDKVYKDAVAEKEADGKKLTKKEKADIYEETVEKLEKGRIDPDTIESVLGGETYNQLKTTAEKEAKLQEEHDALKKEYDTLNKIKLSEITGEQQERQNAVRDRIWDLKSQIKEIKDNSNPKLRTQIESEMSKALEGSKLAESYSDRFRRRQTLEVDVESYTNENAKQTAQNFKDFGANDSKASHDYLDLVTKVAEDRGHTFKFMSTKQLEESIANGNPYNITEDANRIEAFVDGKSKEIIINMDVNKSLPSLVGHEVMHTLETANHYSDAQSALFEYAKTKGEYDDRWASIQRRYGKLSEEQQKQELASDLVGSYLFGDTDFVKNLSTTKPNVFQKIYNEIKYLWNMATAGSKEKRELERVKRDFERIWQEAGSKTGDATARYSLADSDGNQLTKEQQEYFKDSKMRDENGNLKVMYHGTGEGGFHTFNPLYSHREDGFFFADSNTVAKSYSGTHETYSAKTLKTADDLNGLFAEINATDYEAREENGKFVLYEDGDEIATSDTADGLYEEYRDWTGDGYGNANYKVYLNLKNPLVVDAQGEYWDELDKVSTANKKVYDTLRAKSLPNGQISYSYDDGNGKYNSKRVKGEMSDQEFLKTFGMKFFEEVVDNDGEFDTVREKLVIDVDTGKEIPSTTHDYAVYAKENGYDGVIFRNMIDNGVYASGMDRFDSSTVAIAFDSNQIKSVANESPTSDADIRYSLSSMGTTFFGDPDVKASDFLVVDETTQQPRYKSTEGYNNYVNQCLNNMRQTRTDFDESEARQDITNQIDGIVKVAVAAKKAGYDILDYVTDQKGKKVQVKDKRDSKNRLLFSSLEPNSEYTTSHDVSTICDKRKNFAEIYDDIVRTEEAKGVPQGKRFFDKVDNYFYLHKVMADKGLTQPCRQCYVESMRKNLAPMANAFLELVSETDANNKSNPQLYNTSGKNKGAVKVNNANLRAKVLEQLEAYGMSVDDLSVETLTTAEGLAQLRIQAPLIYEAFNSFYGQSKPKMPKQATPFRFGELTALLTDEKGNIKKSLVDKINSTGGFRLQSYSDFQIQNFTDVLQAIFEAGTLGLRGHAYTKVPAFLDATKGTNLKRNISIFMYQDGGEWKIDRNDSFPYSLEEIYQIVNEDESGNTGIIAVSQNEEMSAWIMANNNVGYGIPFHKSGIKMGTVRDTNVRTDDGRIVKGYKNIKDHTKQQTEVWKETARNESGEIVHKANTKVAKGISIYDPSVGWDFDNAEGLSKQELIKKNLMSYIDACNEAGYLPKFREYVMNNSKVLNDVLRFSQEFGTVSQDATIDDISFEYSGYKIPYGYYKFLGDFGMFTPDGNASTHEVLSLKDYNFDDAVKFFDDAESLRRNEILQQFSNGEEREKYRNSNLSTEELEQIVRDKRKEIVDEIVAPVRNRIADDDQYTPKDYGRQTYVRDIMVEDAGIAPVARNTSTNTSTVQQDTSTVQMPIRADYAPLTEELPVEEIAPEGTQASGINAEKAKITEEYEKKKAELQERVADKNTFTSRMARELYTEISNLRKGVKASPQLGVLLDYGYTWDEYKRAFLDIKVNPEARVDWDSVPESLARELIDKEYENAVYDLDDLETAYRKQIAEIDSENKSILGKDLTKKNAEKIRTIQAEIQGHRLTKDVTKKEFDDKIAQKESQYEALSRKDTKKATDLRNQITRLEAKRDSLLRSLDDRIERANKKIENIERESRFEKRRTKQNNYRELFGNLMGDTSTWKDKKMGIYYQTNTFHRNLRDVVRDASGNRDIARADALYDELQGNVNRNEAKKNREANEVKNVFREMKINSAESTYIQMLGELRHNPDTTLTQDVVDEYYRKHSGKIDVQKVDRAIEEARKLYDSLYDRVNVALSEHGFKEIGYRKGYFPHFNDPKQNWLAKLLNWKVQNDEIPTDIAGLTEMFEPQRTWQSFDKHRTSDTTDYNFLKGLDNYVNGSLDWIYHIEDIQKHRAFETEIRYRHSSEAVQKKVDEYRNNPMLSVEDADDLIYKTLKEAENPLHNFVTDLHTRTNILAGKKSSKDRNMESDFNRHAYSVMTNITNRVSANQVAGSISSALTNFIPITQSWGQVNPTSSLVGMKKTIQSYMSDDGVVEKSDFLTNRLAQNEALYKDAWDRIGDKVGGLMEIVDNFTSQTIWRSKYHENIKNGMTEAQAIRDADQFAENVIGGRSKGNMPTIFHAKNPVTKMLTSFQLEVGNQYGYMFKDMPQDIGEKAVGKLVKGYATMFVGAYAYNALYSSLTGRDAALDPIGIIEDFIRDLAGDDDEEKDVAGAVANLASNVADEIPFIGGLLGGGRVPISSALPYDGSISDAYKDVTEGDWKTVLDELSNPLYYGVLPMGGGQIRKTVQGLSMFDKDLPVSGSYTQSGKLRFPVEDTFLNKLQAGVFGQYASKNAREYFDRGATPLNEKQIQEYVDVDIPISEYWNYREGLKGLSKLSDKADYINTLDLPVAKKNILVNNQSDRAEPIDLTGFDDDYADFEEFDFAVKNPEKYEIAEQVGGYKKYLQYQEGMKNMKIAEKVDYVAGLNLTTAQKNALINGETDRKEPIDLTGYENFSSYEEFELSKESPKKYYTSKVIGYDDYMEYMDVIDEIRADKDSNGKTINGSAKRKKTEYINSLDLDYGQRIILYRSLFDSQADKDEYNAAIVEYLNNRDDISYEEMIAILESLDMKVYHDGRVDW